MHTRMFVVPAIVAGLTFSGPVLAQDTNALVLKLVEELDALKAEINPLRALLQGAVVAFDRSQTEGTCPAGWKLFKPAGGRFIVGAGTHDNKDMGGNDLTNYPAFKDKPTEAVGGEEKHLLTKEEMPSHDHGGRTLGSDHLFWADETGAFAVRGPGDFANHIKKDHTHGITAEGQGQAHNTLPPYVALYYCINVKN